MQSSRGCYSPFAVGATTAAFPPVVSLADLSAENERAVAGGAAVAPEEGEADSDGAFGAAMAAGLCSGVCARLGMVPAPIIATDRAAMT
jgi:hypothetical protein